MTTPEVLFESAGAVAYLTFNRPEARNALTWAMWVTRMADAQDIDEIAETDARDYTVIT